MRYRDIIVVICIYEPSKVFYFKFKSINTFKDNFSFQLVFCTKNKSHLIILHIWLNLVGESKFYGFRIRIIGNLAWRHHKTFFTNGSKPHLNIDIIIHHNKSV